MMYAEALCKDAHEKDIHMKEYVYGMTKVPDGDSDKKETTVIFRHDLIATKEQEKKAFTYTLAYRALLVCLLFLKHVGVNEAFDFVDKRIEHDAYIDRSTDPVEDCIDWEEVDRFSLDGSKTFINGKRYV